MKRPKHVTPFDVADEYIANPAAEPVRKRERTARARRMQMTAVFWIAIFLAAMNLVMLVEVLGTGREGTPRGPSSTELNHSPGKALAVQTMLSWLSASPVPLEGGRMLSWDGVEITTPPAPAPGGSQSGPSGVPNYAVEVHRFTVVDGGGVLYSGSVAVEQNDTSGSRLVSTPTLMPIAPSVSQGDAWGASVPWFGWSQQQTPDPVTAAVQSWAVAFTSGDPVKLRQVVGDTNPGHAYVPLGYATDTESSIVVSALADPAEDQEPDASRMLLRVELTASLNGQVIDEEATTRQPITFDVLVVGADTASPRIVSWGAAGSGTSLSDYSVAITGREPSAMTTETPNPADPAASPGDESPSPSPSATQPPVPTPSEGAAG